MSKHLLDNLTSYDILEGFPDECREFIPKKVKDLKRELKPWFDEYKEIVDYGCHDTVTRIFMIGYLDMRKPKEKFKRLKLYEDILYLMVNREKYDITEIDIGRAKQVPCQDIVNLENIKETRTRIQGCCPLHEDKVPSFVIYKDTNSWYCFSENRGGDAIRLYMDIHKCRFTDAIRGLLRK